MSTEQTALDLEHLAETVDLECKAAQGKDGQGELPHDFWKTYSAMANTHGGVILLGVQEKPAGRFHALGLKRVDKVRKALWDNLNNPKQVNINLLSDDDVQPVALQGRTILQVRVPRAPREQRPVYVGANPLTGTYLRLHEGDYQADSERVRRLMAENAPISRDEQILPGMGISLLDPEAVARYQRAFAVDKPGHVWASLPTEDFLKQIGAYGHNWHDGTHGLRLAGLLMFGRAEVIRDVLPYYMVDYQEHAGRDENERWSDRLIPDGTWSGNLYDFFSRVYRKLIADLKVPFRLEGAQRVDDTPAHEALREALVNTLIHADYHAPASILVIKRPDSFSFRNPGRMRVSVESALYGGLSDCRNRRLQTMFQLVGFGDLAGSGVPKIFTRWTSQHWAEPLLQEDLEHELTTLVLRIRPESTGVKPPSGAKFAPENTQVEQNFAPIAPKTTHVEQSHGANPGQAVSTTALIPPAQNMYLDWDEIPSAQQAHLHALAQPVAAHKWVSQEVLRDTILDLCEGVFLGQRVLAHLLQRRQDDLRKRTLNPMVRSGLLRPAHTSSKAPNQAYTRATPSSSQSLT
ncbi:MAG: putative DNA binding domain-containing protein [Lautropia sp.]|nr:putative DNA binding domain-containing protein [Lautropia sp.]